MVKTKRSKTGGFRPGAGRPTGSGRFREKTRPIRIPESLVPQVSELLEYYADGRQQAFGVANDPAIFQSRSNKSQTFPLYATRVAAGFPSPADDHIDSKLDLNQYLVQHPTATFFVRVEGDSMIGAGIHENDLLVVDRSLKPTHGKVVIAVVNGELTVKRLSTTQGNISLIAENERYAPIVVQEPMEFSIWGVVTNVIHGL